MTDKEYGELDEVPNGEILVGDQIVLNRPGDESQSASGTNYRYPAEVLGVRHKLANISAELLSNSFAEPIQILPAPGAGKAWAIVSCIALFAPTVDNTNTQVQCSLIFDNGGEYDDDRQAAVQFASVPDGEDVPRFTAILPVNGGIAFENLPVSMTLILNGESVTYDGEVSIDIIARIIDVS